MRGSTPITRHRRLNITLPEETVRLMDRAVKRGSRSRLIARAVEHYLDAASRARLRGQLKEGAIRRSSRDLSLAEQWLSLEEEAWLSGRV